MNFFQCSRRTRHFFKKETNRSKRGHVINLTLKPMLKNAIWQAHRQGGEDTLSILPNLTLKCMNLKQQ